MNAHHTYKGDRKKANKRVFKLLRLKSNRLLRNYRKKPTTRVQRCSRCHRVGHNAMNKLCSAGLNVTDDHGEGVQEEAVHGGGPVVEREAVHGEGNDGVGGVQEVGEIRPDTTLEDIDDLLFDSDNDDLY
jgi:hypothetical protein